jgi:transposase
MLGVYLSMSTAALTSEPICTHNVPLPTAADLPDDLGTLKRMVAELLTTLRQERLDKEKLRFRIEQLLRQRYGPRTERFHPDQLLLFADWAASSKEAAASPNNAATTDAAASDATTPSRPRRPKTPHGRGKLPEHLPRRQVHHRLSEAERVCRCGGFRVEIGTDVSEQVEWQPASLFVRQHIVHKYLCPDCAAKSAEAAMTAPLQAPQDETTTSATNAATADAATADAATADAAAPTISAPTTIAFATDATPASLHEAPSSEAASTASAAANSIGPAIGPAIISAPKPPSPIAKGLPGPGLLAFIIVSKYFDHLPLYRLEHILKRQGLPLSRSTMCDWMAASAETLRPLYVAMVSQVLRSAWLHTDDTSVKNQGHAPGTTALSRFWIYWGDRTHPYNVFDFTINRKRDGPQTFLAEFHGYLHADAFSGYDALYLPPPRPQAIGAASASASIIEVACNAHARRKFHEARGSDDLRAHQALAYYAQLYALERGATDAELDDDARLRMRQELAVPILEQFHKWLTEQRAQVLPKSPMAEAIGYALNNWTALLCYTKAGFLSIDNNVAEREMKRIAIGRKNWLFVGSAKGGRTAAVLFSFTSTCHRLGIEPWAYLQDVLARLPITPAERLGELLPDHWQAAQPQAAQAQAATSANSASASPSAS